MIRHFSAIFAATVAIAAVCQAIHAQEPPAAEKPSVSPNPSQTPTGPDVPELTSSLGEGERAAALKASVELERKRLVELQETLEKQDKEFNAATEAAASATAAMETKQAEIKELTDAGDRQAAAKSIEELTALRKAESVARERLEVAVKAGKTAQEQLRIVETKIAEQQLALDKLSGGRLAWPAGDRCALKGADR